MVFKIILKQLLICKMQLSNWARGTRKAQKARRKANRTKEPRGARMKATRSSEARRARRKARRTMEARRARVSFVALIAVSRL